MARKKTTPTIEPVDDSAVDVTPPAADPSPVAVKAEKLLHRTLDALASRVERGEANSSLLKEVTQLCRAVGVDLSRAAQKAEAIVTAPRVVDGRYALPNGMPLSDAAQRRLEENPGLDPILASLEGYDLDSLN